MSKKARILSVTFLAAAFAVLGGWGIQGHFRASHYQRQLQNSYLHAFTELSTAARELDSALQKVCYTTPGPLQDSLFQQIYAKSLAAQYALGELPYGNIELEQTAAFFAKTGDYASAMLRQTDSGGTDSFVQLCAASGELNDTLAALRAELEAGALSFTQVERVTQELSQAAETGEQELGGVTFQNAEADFPELPSLVYDGPFSEHLVGAQPKALEGMGEVSREAAQEAAANFLHCKPGALTLLSAGSGTLPTYFFSLPQDGGTGYIEVTRQGGQVLEYFQDRAVPEAVLDAREGVELAQNYLANWGFGQMEPSYHIQREGRLTIHFAPVADGVYCYPDLIKITIALDTGRLLGYEAHGYLTQHTQRALPAPLVTQEEAQGQVPEPLRVLRCQRALIPTAGGSEERTTYEFQCEAPDGSHVLIYVNDQTGQQQNILLLLEDESGTLTL